MSLDLVQTAIVAAVAGGAGRVVAAPVDALAAEFQARVRERLSRTRAKAEAKAGGDLHRVPDRIAFKALQEAAIADDEIAAEYLGGVLAGSGEQDDTGASVVALISRLSSVDLLLHYVIYREVRRLATTAVALGKSTEARKAAIRIPDDSLQRVFPGRELAVLVHASLPALSREGLIQDEKWNPGTGMEVTPTARGAALFLWGHGVGCAHFIHIFERTAHGQPLVFTMAVAATPETALVQPPASEAG